MKRIIVVDDDPGLQEIYKIILEKAGYAVTVFPSGKEIMSNNFSLPDLFLLDKQLSGMDGLDICKFLKDQVATRHIPVIVISATAGIEKLVSNAGADAFIEKPFERKHLLHEISEFIGVTT